MLRTFIRTSLRFLAGTGRKPKPPKCCQYGRQLRDLWHMHMYCMACSWRCLKVTGKVLKGPWDLNLEHLMIHRLSILSIYYPYITHVLTIFINHWHTQMHCHALPKPWSLPELIRRWWLTCAGCKSMFADWDVLYIISHSPMMRCVFFMEMKCTFPLSHPILLALRVVVAC